jgi:hypothetical protein
MGHATLDGQIIKNGYLWSVLCVCGAFVLICAYHACYTKKVDLFFTVVQFILLLIGVSTNALLTLAEYTDRSQTLARHTETHPLLQRDKNPVYL